jgi:hypothetical protein
VLGHAHAVRLQARALVERGELDDAISEAGALGLALDLRTLSAVRDLAHAADIEGGACVACGHLLADHRSTGVCAKFGCACEQPVAFTAAGEAERKGPPAS